MKAPVYVAGLDLGVLPIGIDLFRLFYQHIQGQLMHRDHQGLLLHYVVFYRSFI